MDFLSLGGGRTASGHKYKVLKQNATSISVARVSLSPSNTTLYHPTPLNTKIDEDHHRAHANLGISSSN